MRPLRRTESRLCVKIDFDIAMYVWNPDVCMSMCVCVCVLAVLMSKLRFTSKQKQQHFGGFCNTQ